MSVTLLGVYPREKKIYIVYRNFIHNARRPSIEELINKL